MASHWSFSQWNQFTSCGHQFKLARIDRVPQVPSVAAVAGRAFHSWTEMFDLGYSPDWEEELAEAVQSEWDKTGCEPSEWKVSGRATKANPNKDDLDVWLFLGQELCQKYEAWSGATKLKIAMDLPPDANGNTSGIEYALNVELNSELSYVAYLDRVGFNEYGQLGVWDIKTGSRMPKSVQMGTYVAGAKAHGLPLSWGAYYNARKGELTEPMSLSQWAPDRLIALLEFPHMLRENEVYPIVPGDACGLCDVKAHCSFAL